MLMAAYCVFAYLVGVGVGRWYERRQRLAALAMSDRQMLDAFEQIANGARQATAGINALMRQWDAGYVGTWSHK